MEMFSIENIDINGKSLWDLRCTLKAETPDPAFWCPSLLPTCPLRLPDLGLLPTFVAFSKDCPFSLATSASCLLGLHSKYKALIIIGAWKSWTLASWIIYVAWELIQNIWTGSVQKGESKLMKLGPCPWKELNGIFSHLGKGISKSMLKDDTNFGASLLCFYYTGDSDPSEVKNKLKSTLRLRINKVGKIE